MPAIIILDTGVLRNCVVQISNPSGGKLTPSEFCRQWLTDCERGGAAILVPAIIYYETLREIERLRAVAQRKRLIECCFQSNRFIPLTTAQLESAAQLWAQARNTGSLARDQSPIDLYPHEPTSLGSYLTFV